MGRQTGDQSRLFYSFNVEERIPAHHLLRRLNPTVTHVLAELRAKLRPFYSEIGRPSIDPGLMLRMLIVGYCYGRVNTIAFILSLSWGVCRRTLSLIWT